VKHLCISDTKLRILYASKYYPGTVHDKSMLEEESCETELPPKIKILFDLAFLGVIKPNAIMPNKKPKGKEMTKIQKKKNRVISRIRVKIENSFAGVKRLYSTYNVCRIRNESLIDLVFSVSCGLWNYYLYEN
jgi:hypothetical protein